MLGASHARRLHLAFLLPNIFRRLFGEGAFSPGFVPLFSRRLARRAATRTRRHFSNEVLAVFLPALLLITVIFEIIMPACSWLVAGELSDRSRTSSSSRST